MTLFLALLLANGAAALAALWQVRPALFMLAANQFTVLWALRNIEAYGQPRSQQFLPASVFSPENLQIAGLILLLTSAPVLLASLWPARAPARVAPLPPLPHWLLALLGVYLLAVVLSQRTILTNAYTDPERMLFDLNLSGGHAFLTSLVLYEVVRRVLDERLSRLAAFGALFVLFLFTDFLRGATGLAAGFLVFAAVLILGREPRPARRALTLVAALAAVSLLSFGVRELRSTFHTEGASSVGSLFAKAREDQQRVARNAEGVETASNAVQYAAHVLECVSLYEAGISRQWRSVYLPIVYTLQPSFLAEPLGLTRPKEAAWELREYFTHGGGTFVPGELYWNGGYLCVLLVFGALVWICWRFDTRAPASFVWLLAACEFTPNLLMGVGYGFAQVSRGLFNAALALLVWAAARRWTARRAAAWSPAAGR